MNSLMGMGMGMRWDLWHASLAWGEALVEWSVKNDAERWREHYGATTPSEVMVLIASAIADTASVADDVVTHPDQLGVLSMASLAERITATHTLVNSKRVAPTPNSTGFDVYREVQGMARHSEQWEDLVKTSRSVIMAHTLASATEYSQPTLLLADRRPALASVHEIDDL